MVAPLSPEEAPSPGLRFPSALGTRALSAKVPGSSSSEAPSVLACGLCGQQGPRTERCPQLRDPYLRHQNSNPSNSGEINGLWQHLTSSWVS